MHSFMSALRVPLSGGGAVLVVSKMRAQKKISINYICHSLISANLKFWTRRRNEFPSDVFRITRKSRCWWHSSSRPKLLDAALGRHQ